MIGGRPSRPGFVTLAPAGTPMRRSFFTLDVFTDAVPRGQSAGRRARGRGARRGPHAGDRPGIQPFRDRVRPAAARSGQHGAGQNFHARSRTTLCGPPHGGDRGTAGRAARPELIGRQDLSIVLEEQVGIVQCIARRQRGKTRASFTLPVLPARVGDTLPPQPWRRPCRSPRATSGSITIIRC